MTLFCGKALFSFSDQRLVLFERVWAALLWLSLCFLDKTGEHAGPVDKHELVPKLSTALFQGFSFVLHGHNADMTRTGWWWVGIAATVVVPLLGAVLLVQFLLGCESLRTQVQQRVRDALGVPVSIQSLRLSWWEAPALVIEDLSVETKPALQIRQLRLRPAWNALWRGKLELDAVALREAVLSRAGLHAVWAAWRQRRELSDGQSFLAVPLPRHLLMQDVQFTDLRGQSMVFEGQVRWGEDLWPNQLEWVVLRGRLQGSRLQLQRLEARRWRVRLNVAGGLVEGSVEWLWPARAGGEHAIQGELRARAVELSRLTASEPVAQVWARQPLRGTLQAQTLFRVRARQLDGLLDGLVTQSRFTIHGAVLQGVDLIKAVQTVGVSRGGQTALDTLAGEVTTRGKTVDLHNLVASSGPLSATGRVRVSAQQELSGRVQVSLGGAMGVPLTVGGTVDEPQVSLTAGAKIGAAIGTLLMPGVGTGAGASVGGQLGELFGK